MPRRPGEKNEHRARSEPEIAGVLSAEHSVTMVGYLEFPSHVVQSEGLEAARADAPRGWDDPRTCDLLDGLAPRTCTELCGCRPAAERPASTESPRA